MNVLVIGSGGREHAIVYALSKSEKVSKIYAIPGNAGIANLATCMDLAVDDFKGILNKVIEHEIDLTVIGPEVPLVLGLSDYLESKGHMVFGVSRKASRLEGSKAYAKAFMEKYQIPTAKYVTVNTFEEGVKALEEFDVPLVIKADGLAGGKGVLIVHSKQEAIDQLRNLLVKGSLKDAGKRVVIEEYLEGFECSLLCFTDGMSIKPMVSVKDHKQIGDGNVGLNTGGMGSVSPNPFLKDGFEETVNEVVLKPFMKGILKEGLDYRGVIFIGLMITRDGIKVLEFNVRFGDPETQAILLRLETDLVDVLVACCTQKLNEVSLCWSKQYVACVVLASKGYPLAYEMNKKIVIEDGIDDEIINFHAGTKMLDGSIVSNGGRVLNVCAKADTLKDALNKVYKAISKIYFDGMYYRHDIGL